MPLRFHAAICTTTHHTHFSMVILDCVSLLLRINLWRPLLNMSPSRWSSLILSFRYCMLRLTSSHWFLAFNYPTTSLSPHSPRLFSMFTDCSHLQCVAGDSPPLIDGGNKRGIYHQNCADPALSVAAFFITHHTKSFLLPHLTVARCAGQLNALRREQVCLCVFQCLCQMYMEQSLFLPVTNNSWLIFQPSRCFILGICLSRLL